MTPLLMPKSNATPARSLAKTAKPSQYALPATSVKKAGSANNAVKPKRWDSAEHLDSDEAIAAYLDACFAEAGEDIGFIAKALGNVARARGMAHVADKAQLGRESLYKALRQEGNPSFSTVLKVTHALGMKFRVTPLH